MGFLSYTSLTPYEKSEIAALL